MPLPPRALLHRTLAGLVLGALLLSSTGCMYDDHYSFGATEKWVHSDTTRVPKVIGTPFVAIVDGIIGPFTAASDEWGSETVYNENHKYLSYAGSRVVARSDIGLGYQWIASVPAITFDTLWLIVTGPIDLVTVLASDHDEGPSPVAAVTHQPWTVLQPEFAAQK